MFDNHLVMCRMVGTQEHDSLSCEVSEFDALCARLYQR
ncbi:hypothetical protein VP409E501_P0077 [Vibrio phage 409E50-1]|nr:hypothetical protein VP521E561_P0077 [Vibrio phage 521E56-1]CAH9013166.1 hypothetical protein VP384E501_P0077 [Vibrio phage 384E50-1]CAH9013193.1 hypothetical protein VP409E501_P0077 [Vibrio phage 409E50-1]CAH9013227.1 hypothetical protein VP402E501_P0077 [Vibrio phage 402E50-1]CAH9013883.1 hypothetical protein VP405E501_P0077 [Vibrio phage 405E50-1]CAH9013939.1 hypothetical protein VP413E501_P0077 [Vibrio phage 413E50-1]